MEDMLRGVQDRVHQLVIFIHIMHEGSQGVFQDLTESPQRLEIFHLPGRVDASEVIGNRIPNLRVM
jgi:hypothetical protein